mmetsp:Transcript_8620/g.16687  ORF Transcript_8620/g.16687 Transcript_8620/m.16687 type:complete len:763 (-) Transcript_8620:186-2474(-)
MKTASPRSCGMLATSRLLGATLGIAVFAVLFLCHVRPRPIKLGGSLQGGKVGMFSRELSAAASSSRPFLASRDVGLLLTRSFDESRRHLTPRRGLARGQPGTRRAWRLSPRCEERAAAQMGQEQQGYPEPGGQQKQDEDNGGAWDAEDQGSVGQVEDQGWEAAGGEAGGEGEEGAAQPEEGDVLPPGVQNAIGALVKAVQENPRGAAVTAAAAGVTLTGGAALSNILSSMPAPVMALEEALGFAVLAYYVPQYALSVERRNRLQASINDVWERATGERAPWDDGTTRAVVRTDAEKDAEKSGVYAITAEEEEQRQAKRQSLIEDLNITSTTVEQTEEEVTDVIDGVFQQYNAKIPTPVKTALTDAITEIRLEDIKYREDYAVLVQEFELLSLERKELSDRVDKMEGELARLDQECVMATERVRSLEALLQSTEMEAKVQLDRMKEGLAQAVQEAADAEFEKQALEEKIQDTAMAERNERLEAQVTALKSRLEEALDDTELAQQRAMDADKEFKATKESLDSKVESLKQQLEIARLMEATRESETRTLEENLGALIDDETSAASAIADLEQLTASMADTPLEQQQAIPVLVEDIEKRQEKADEIVDGAVAAIKGAEEAWESLSAASETKEREVEKKKKTTKAVDKGDTPKKKPLSKMNKTELIAECELYGLETSGKVAELRVRIRAAQKAQKSSGGDKKKGAAAASKKDAEEPQPAASDEGTQSSKEAPNAKTKTVISSKLNDKDSDENEAEVEDADDDSLVI